MDGDSTFSFVLLFIGTTVISIYVIWGFSRSRFLLRRWANENGFQILDFKLNLFRPTSWFWTSSNSQTVYYVRVRDKDGRERRGWVRCGNFLLGIISSKTEVKWETHDD